MHLTTKCLAALVLLKTQLVSAANSDAWRSRSIYQVGRQRFIVLKKTSTNRSQVFTDRFARSDGSTTAECDTAASDYCGGTWQGLINRLDYIQNAGFDAVWISPVTHQVEGHTIDGSAYHGYWQDDIYALNEHFGTEDDLRNLAAELHSRGMVC